MRSSSAAIEGLIVAGLLISIGCTSATDKWIADLSDPDPTVRRGAARALGSQEVISEAAVAPLAAAAADSDVGVRETAILALGQIGSGAKSCLPVLEQALGDSEMSVRVATALAIQKIEPANETYAPILVAALRAGHGPVYFEVARMGPAAEWAVPTLVKMLGDPRGSIRALAARTLGEIGVADDNVKTALERATRDGNPAVRDAAQQALERIHAN